MRTGEWGTGANGGTQRAHGGLEGSGHTSDPFSGSAFLFFGILSGGGGSTSGYRWAPARRYLLPSHGLHLLPENQLETAWETAMETAGVGEGVQV